MTELFKYPTILTWVAKPQYCKLVEDSTWFNIHWTTSTVSENWIKSLGKRVYIHLFVPYKNSNSWNLITLLSHISQMQQC